MYMIQIIVVIIFANFDVIDFCLQITIEFLMKENAIIIA